MSTKYAYLVSDTANNKVNPGKLSEEIIASSITISIDNISVDSGNLDIWFKADISAGEQTTLDGIVAAHDGIYPADIHLVTPDLATMANPDKDVQRVAVQPGRSGHYMCDRDIKISTAIVGSGALQDLKVNPSNNQQEDWGEMSLVGCYKLVDGSYVTCVDQADADVNAVLSIYDFIAKNQTTDAAIDYDFKGGALWSDNNLASDVWEHRMYAMMAPNIPASMGGSVRFFDGYLYPYQGKWQEAVNSLAIKIDPSATVEAARIRFWLYYPAGAKQNHVLRFITFRKAETN